MRRTSQRIQNVTPNHVSATITASDTQGGRSSRGITLGPVVGALAMIIAFLIGVRSLSISSQSGMRPPGNPLTNQELAVVLDRLRLTPPVLAGAGLSDEQTTTLVGNMRAFLQTHIEQIRADQIAYGDANVACDALIRSVESGVTSDAQALARARATLEAARTTFNSDMNEALTAAEDGLGAAAVDAIATVRTNVQWDLPTQYLFASNNRAQGDWVTLRDSLSNLRIAAKYSQDPNPDCAQVVAAADADAPVSQAATNISLHGQSVTAAWNNAVFQ